MMSGVACGMRGPPPRPEFRSLDPSIAESGGLAGGFKVILLR